MLLVGVRRDFDGGETALPARVTAVASDLLGKRQQLEMREVRSGDPGSGPGQGLIDYVGTARVIAPDTLHFDVRVAPEGGTAMELRFNRGFFTRCRRAEPGPFLLFQQPLQPPLRKTGASRPRKSGAEGKGGAAP